MRIFPSRQTVATYLPHLVNVKSIKKSPKIWLTWDLWDHYVCWFYQSQGQKYEMINGYLLAPLNTEQLLCVSLKIKKKMRSLINNIFQRLILKLFDLISELFICILVHGSKTRSLQHFHVCILCNWPSTFSKTVKGFRFQSQVTNLNIKINTGVACCTNFDRLCQCKLLK